MMRLKFMRQGVLVLVLSALVGASWAKLPILIPRDVLFGNPAIIAVQISPDGKQLSYVAPSDKGVLNIWVAPVNDLKKAKMITHDTHRGITSYSWSMDNRTILYSKDNDGDENAHLYQIDLTSNAQDPIIRDLTPFPGRRVMSFILSRRYHDLAYVGLNVRDKALSDLYRLNLKTGALTEVAKNDGKTLGWEVDHDFVVRGRYTRDIKTGGMDLWLRKGQKSPWLKAQHWPFGNSGSIVTYSKDNQRYFLTSNHDSDTSVLSENNADNGRMLHKIYQAQRSDIASVLVDPNTYKLQAVKNNYLKPKWHVLDPDVKADFARLEKIDPSAEFSIVSNDYDDRIWVVATYSPQYPGHYYLYNRDSKQLRFLFDIRPKLAKYTLAPVKPVEIKAQDGLVLPGYLTLPIGVKHKDLPMVLYVHGGPWARDSWGYSGTVQWLANRGYVVLQVNFRGSSGFGKRFLNAGNLQWGKAMQRDLSDARQWAIDQGYANPKRIAIYGGSYGGYAVLAGLTFTPKEYACGVDLFGPSDLNTFMNSIPPYWTLARQKLLRRIGPVNTDSAFNEAISPLYHIDKIRVPLLIAQGRTDPRVKEDQSEMIVKAMRKKNLPMQYMIFPDEGHGFARPPNRLAFFGETEPFLKRCLDGRMQASAPVKNTSMIEG